MTDRPKDKYRFDLWPWLRKQQRQHDVDFTFILGDLTDKKDKHSAKLVNAIVEGLQHLIPPVYVLQGNHDYVDPANPFFKFLSGLEGISFITTPMLLKIAGIHFLCVPHQWDGWPDFNWLEGRPDYILIHQCIEGAIAESGARLNGLETATIERLRAKRILAGDIHRPQDVGAVAYVGAPYHVRFGDDFQPRCVLLDTKHDLLDDIHFEAPAKRSLTIREVGEIDGQVKQGDHVKITVDLTREEAFEWQRVKKAVLDECRRLDLEVYGVEMKVQKAKERRRASAKEIASKDPKVVFEEFTVVEKVSAPFKREGALLLEEGNADQLRHAGQER